MKTKHSIEIELWAVTKGGEEIHSVGTLNLPAWVSIAANKVKVDILKRPLLWRLAGISIEPENLAEVVADKLTYREQCPLDEKIILAAGELLLEEEEAKQ